MPRTRSRAPGGPRNFPPEQIQPAEISKRFAIIRKRAKLLGLPTSELDELESVVALRRRRLAKVSKALAVLFVAAVASAIVQVPFSRLQLVSFYVSLLDGETLDASHAKCLVDQQAVLDDLTRVPTGCDFCTGRSSIRRVANLSREEFEEKFAYSGVPVIVTDATNDWSAPKAFSYDFLRQLYAPGSKALDDVARKCQFFPFKSDFSTLEEVFGMSEDRARHRSGQKPWYIGWSNCDVGVGTVLRSHYSRPYFLPEVAQDSRTDWIFMGSPGYGAHVHVDYVGLPSWQAQLTGTKKWTFVPPPECYFKCHGQFQVVVHPGEIIVMDTNIWFHGTQIVGDNMSITIGSEFD